MTIRIDTNCIADVVPGGKCTVMLDLSPSAIAEKEQEHGTEFWQLRTPLTRFAQSDRPTGIDNGCFSGDLPEAWGRMIIEARKTKPLWACSPDIVGSARRTMELWPRFSGEMRAIPRALVAQDGIGDFDIPWAEVACIFIGGTDPFKVSSEAMAVAKTARILGKWVHVGRVNTYDRAFYWADIADSVDGSGISRDPRGTQLVDVLRGIKRETQQLEMAV